jgi:1,2-diacylglycerol 3-beta-galactosyltransferase
MVKIAKALNRPESGIQLILLCGKHAEVASELRAMPKHIPMFVEGFTKDIPLFMELADFFIGKPGPGSISEALAKHLPVVVQRNAWTLAQERYNADWVEEQGVGVVVSSVSEISSAVQKLLAPKSYAGYRRRAMETRNFAIFEIPQLLDDVLTRASEEPPELTTERIFA